MRRHRWAGPAAQVAHSRHQPHTSTPGAPREPSSRGGVQVQVLVGIGTTVGNKGRMPMGTHPGHVTHVLRSCFPCPELGSSLCAPCHIVKQQTVTSQCWAHHGATKTGNPVCGLAVVVAALVFLFLKRSSSQATTVWVDPSISW